MALDVEASDVIRLVLQFCKENGLTNSFAALSSETQVSLNTVDSVDLFLRDVQDGRWDLVLPQVTHMRLPKRKLEDLYEQVAVETIESAEFDAAKSLLRESFVMTEMRVAQPERHNALERLLERAVAGKLELHNAYPNGSSREKRRNAVAKALQGEVTTAPPSRLLALLGQALKWQKQNGTIKPGDALDVFRGEQRLTVVSTEETFPTELHRTIKLGKKNHAESVVCSPDGQTLAVGSADGFIELYDWNTGKLRLDLSYQVCIARFPNPGTLVADCPE
jgi:WD40 repeat-containing protein SMU1